MRPSRPRGATSVRWSCSGWAGLFRDRCPRVHACECAARQRLIAFVGRCADEQWTSSPLGYDDPRSVGVIVDHVADAYEYLGSLVTKLVRGEPVEVSPEIVDELNALHSAALTPTREAAIEHLVRSGDAFVALIEPLGPEQLSAAEGRVSGSR